MRIEVETEPGHIALDHRDGDRGFAARSATRMPHLRPDDDGGEQDQAYARGRQHHRRRRIPLTTGSPPLLDFQRDRGQAASDQRYPR